MQPKYSILLCNQPIAEYKPKIQTWLASGIKVFWFGSHQDVEFLNRQYPEFCKAYLCNGFVVPTTMEAGIVVDGYNCEKTVAKLEKLLPLFNAAQYRVEHCCVDSHIVVEASAGTGKTTVMIDRIMFMLHTIPGIKLSDIAMITFTNEATSQMSIRLQEVLLKRYRLTKDIKYLLWMEEQANMQISTIDSFSFWLMKHCGIVGGFSQQVRIKTLNYERKELIRNLLDDMVKSGESVSSQLGLSYYKTTNLIDSFWNRVAQLGLSTDAVLAMDWGKGSNGDSYKFQKTMRLLIENLTSEYAEAKRSSDAVTLQDLKRDINVLLPLAITNGVISECGFKYLFVDEFQDSDNSQIAMLHELVKGFHLKLFVVGDVKQSIYRFRGAIDSAFVRLIAHLRNDRKTPLYQFELMNNYRTAPNVMSVFSKYFAEWSNQRLLTSAAVVRPCKKIEGSATILRSSKRGFDEGLFISEIKKLLSDFRSRFKNEQREADSKNRIVVLTRTNRQVSEVARLLDKYQIPAVAKRDGTFYQSDAVKDFYAFICSFLYCNEPIYVFNYLASPYSGITEALDYQAMVALCGNRDDLQDYLNQFLSRTNWLEYFEALKTRPTLAVIKDVFEREPYLQNYIARRKQIKAEAGWEEEDITSSVLAEAIKYKANIDKLLELLHQSFKSESVTINKIASFLKNAIATNRDESEADVEADYQYDCVYCMTVHKAKGLEFDTVVLPFMNTPFFYRDQTEILIDGTQTKIAWNVGKRDSDKDLHNDFYSAVRREEDFNATAEETRILYVAMTRTIHSFLCIMSKSQDENCWNGLFEKVGVPNE